MKNPIPEGHNPLAYLFTAALIGMVIWFLVDGL